MNRQHTRPASDPATVAENAEQTLIAELRPCIRSILFAADKPMATTAIGAAARERGCRVPGHLIYRALVALERDAQARRAGRAGTAARSEVLWQLALTTSELNPEFAHLAAESVDADHAAARGCTDSGRTPQRR